MGFALAGCGRDAPEAGPTTAGAHAQTQLPVWVEAAPATQYYARCHIRTFKDPSGRNAFGELQGFANTYVIDTSGPFRDLLPSPNAQCLFAKIKGVGDVVLHIQKKGDHTARARKPMTWVRLNVW